MPGTSSACPRSIAYRFVSMRGFDTSGVQIHVSGDTPPIHLPGEMATSEPRRPGRPQKVPPPGSYRRPPAPRLRPGRVYCGEEACPFSIRVKRLPPACSVPYWWGECCSAVRRSPSSRWARGCKWRRRAPAKASAEKASVVAAAPRRPRPRRRRGQVRGGQVRRRLLCPNRHRSRWQGLARRVPRGGQGPCR